MFSGDRDNPCQVNLVTGDPAVVPETKFRVRGICSMRYQIGLSIRRMLVVFTEINEMGGSDLNRITVDSCLPEQWLRRGKSSLSSGTPIIRTGSESYKRSPSRAS